MKSVYPFILSFAFLHTACLSTFLGTKEKRSRDYSYTEPGSGWKRMDPAQADASFRSNVDQSILNVTSVCGDERFRSLEDLSADILKQLPENKASKAPEPLTVDGHPALRSEVEGQVDGLPMQVKLLVIRGPRCVYDLMLAGGQLDPTSLETFNKTASGFRIGKN